MMAITLETGVTQIPPASLGGMTCAVKVPQFRPTCCRGWVATCSFGFLANAQVADWAAAVEGSRQQPPMAPKIRVDDERPAAPKDDGPERLMGRWMWYGVVMTVADLIAKLQQLPPDLPVIQAAEGNWGDPEPDIYEAGEGCEGRRFDTRTVVF